MKFYAPLVLAAGALAAPDADPTALLGDIPSSILSVIETAVPISWAAAAATNEAFVNSVAHDALTGKYPDWYSSLPNNVKQWASGYIASAAAEVTGATGVTGVTGAPASATGASGSAATGDAGASGASGAAGSSAAASSGSSSGSSAASGSAGAKSTSTAGAPAATAAAMGIAGAAGLAALMLA